MGVRRGSRSRHPLVQWRSIADHAVDGRSSDIDPEENIRRERSRAVLRHCPADREVVRSVGRLRQRRPGDAAAARSRTLLRALRRPPRRSHRLARPRHPVAPGANLVWPADRSWCVATEIDWDFTLVACPDGVADATLVACADEFADAYAREPDLETYSDPRGDRRPDLGRRLPQRPCTRLTHASASSALRGIAAEKVLAAVLGDQHRPRCGPRCRGSVPGP